MIDKHSYEQVNLKGEPKNLLYKFLNTAQYLNRIMDDQKVALLVCQLPLTVNSNFGCTMKTPAWTPRVTLWVKRLNGTISRSVHCLSVRLKFLMGGWDGGNSERCLKWGSGGGWGSLRNLSKKTS